MLSNSTRLKLEEILTKVAFGQEVTLSERIYLSNLADKDQKIAALLTRAKRMKSLNNEQSGIDKLLNDLDIGFSDPDGAYKPNQDDLGDWFMGAPSWLGRS